ncbi:hypothetical protein GCM10010424_04840 [Streptomyces lienomycini]
MTASRAVRIGTARCAGTREPGARPARPAAAGSTGTHSTVPHGHPSSGRGHRLSAPQAPQRTPIHSSSHARWVTAVAARHGSSSGATGAPQAHGYDGAV